MVLFSLIGFAVIYAALMGTDIFLLAKFAKAGPTSAESELEAIEPEPQSVE
jgi:cytochrome bd-type quinol oxidase subunit 1